MKMNMIYNDKLIPWTSEVKTHGKACEHFKVSFGFLISWKKNKKRGRKLVYPKNGLLKKAT